MSALEEFMQKVKDGKRRGASVQEEVAENVLVELSVADFQSGHIHLRVFVDDERIDPETGMHFRRLHGIDSKYADIHEEVAARIRAEEETPVKDAHEWTVSRLDVAEGHAEHGWLPSSFNPATTVAFDEHIQLRDDVTIIEAMETNRRPENKPDKYKESDE